MYMYILPIEIANRLPPNNVHFTRRISHVQCALCAERLSGGGGGGGDVIEIRCAFIVVASIHSHTIPLT